MQYLRLAFLAAVCGVGVEAVKAADLVRLSPQTWDEFVPHGKEVDAIYGDAADAAVAAHKAHLAAQAVLESAPDDPKANLASGMYLGFLCGEWDVAFPLLSKGSDAKLAAIAKQELENPQEPADRKKLGDAWFEWIAKAKDEWKPAARRRAGHWFYVAINGLKGRDLTAAQKRRDELEQFFTAPAVPLADLPIVKSYRGQGKIGKGGEPIVVDDVESPNGLWAHTEGPATNSMMVFNLDENFWRFSGKVAIHDAARNNFADQFIFRLVGDKKVLWTSRPLNRTRTSESFEVNIASVKELTLESQTEKGVAWAWGVWFEPMLIPKQLK